MVLPDNVVKFLGLLLFLVIGAIALVAKHSCITNVVAVVADSAADVGATNIRYLRA